MSQDYHHNQQGLFSFTDQQDETQIRRDNHKLRIQGFEHHPLVGISHAPEGASSGSMHPAVYETAGMLSEMLNFGGGPAAGDSTAGSMQFFLSDPQPRAPSPPPPQHHQFTWVPGVENRGLSLSLSSSLEAAKAEEELRSGGGMMFFGNQETQNQHVLQLQGYGLGQHSGHFGFGSTPPNATSPIGAVNVLRNSKYTKATQELLEEFCSVGRGHLKKNNFSRNNSMSSSTTSAASGSGGVGPSSSNSAKDLPPLSPADRMEHQRRKVKLLSMLDEVERRYSHYCEQMQMVVNSYDVVMGYGAAIPYTALAQKAMSRHFRCLKDAIQAQLKHSCELLGEKDVSSSTGLTKGETPRLKVLEQSLRQQRAFHQMGMMDQEAWRPQRGLPERSVNILRAWLFEHFLHPYPSDADKHLLARQTGLSRNQVSNWFINARVRLWKPMVEEMYQQESKDGEDDDDDHEEDEQRQDNEERESAQTSMHLVSATTTTLATATETLATNKRSQINVSENDPSLFAINGNTNLNRQFSGGAELEPEVNAGVWPAISHFDDFGTTTVGGRQHQRHDEDGVGGPTVIRFGTAGDVSLTLGLRHSSTGGNPPEKSGFSFRDFGN